MYIGRLLSEWEELEDSASSQETLLWVIQKLMDYPMAVRASVARQLQEE
jgi:hypothetical protein